MTLVKVRPAACCAARLLTRGKDTRHSSCVVFPAMQHVRGAWVRTRAHHRTDPSSDPAAPYGRVAPLLFHACSRNSKTHVDHPPSPRPAPTDRRSLESRDACASFTGSEKEAVPTPESQEGSHTTRQGNTPSEPCSRHRHGDNSATTRTRGSE